MLTLIDPVELSQRLICCPSVTPEEGGALQLLEKELRNHGFSCTRIDRGGVANLYARWGTKNDPKTFGFCGHTDVVPPGDAKAWRFAPFDAVIKNGMLYGRGAADMKSGVAAFVAAACACVQKKPKGAIALLITGDEEGKAQDGTCALLDWMHSQNEKMHCCLVGEPTSLKRLGDTLKIGRRGSMSAHFTLTGIQGHTAYPERARNPLPALALLVRVLAEPKLDKGTAHFDSSTLAVTTIDTGNSANNVIPASARFSINIRFNDLHSSASLTKWLENKARDISKKTDIDISFMTQISGESFLTPLGDLSKLIADSITKETGLQPAYSTSGGTSDARFIKNHCPVVEFGLVGQTMHKVNESVAVEDIVALSKIYNRILTSFFDLSK